MALKTCPLCGNTEDDGKEYRLAIFIGDNRIAVIPPGKVTLRDALKIVRGTPDAYLMQEVLKDGRIAYSKAIGTSDYETKEGMVVKK